MYLKIWKERYWKGDGNVTFTKPFLMLGKVTFDEHVNVLEIYCKGCIIHIYKALMALIPKSKVLKGLILRSVSDEPEVYFFLNTPNSNTSWSSLPVGSNYNGIKGFCTTLSVQGRKARPLWDPLYQLKIHVSGSLW